MCLIFLLATATGNRREPLELSFPSALGDGDDYMEGCGSSRRSADGSDDSQPGNSPNQKREHQQNPNIQRSKSAVTLTLSTERKLYLKSRSEPCPLTLKSGIVWDIAHSYENFKNSKFKTLEFHFEDPDQGGRILKLSRFSPILEL